VVGVSEMSGWAAWVVGCGALGMVAQATELKSLRQHSIGHYEPLHLSSHALVAQHQAYRKRRGMSSYTTAKVAPVELDFKAHGRSFNLRLHSAAHKLFTSEFVADVRTDDGPVFLSDFDTSVFYHGSLDGNLDTMISAQIEDGILTAQIHDGPDQYYIEPAHKYFDAPNFSNIIYKGSDSVPHDEAHEWEGAAYQGLKARQDEYVAQQTNTGRHRRQTTPYNSALNTCGLAVVIDKRLMDAKYLTGGTYNQNGAIRDALRLVDGMSLIFRSTAFTIAGNTQGGVVQFAVKRVIVYTTDVDNPYAGQATCAGTSQANDCDASAECAQSFLDMLTQASPNTTSPDAGWDDFCLVTAITHRDFCLGVLGLAWVATPSSPSAGICARRSGSRGSLNAGIVTTINFGQDVSLAVQVITMTHEAGHNTGSAHDTTGLLSSTGADCAPGGNAGNYIMYVKATDGDATNNDHFSECSKESMAEVIEAQSSGCFEAATSFTCGATALVGGSCGNGIIDVNEDCECSGQNDPHCDCNSCEIVPGKECSFLSGDPCCGSDGMLLGLNLTATVEGYMRVLNSTASQSIGEINSLLDAEFGTASRCSAGAECTMNRYCIKDTRFVAYTGQDIGSCPQIDFVANLANISEMAPTGAVLPATEDVTCFNFTDGCSDDITACSSLYPSCDDALADNLINGGPRNGSHCYLFHMSNFTTCNSGNSLCRFNGCTGSICGTFPRVDGGSDGATRCRVTTDESKSCHLACNFGGAEGCVSTFDFNSTYPNMTGIAGAFLSPGRSCTIDGDEFGGRCDGTATCTPLTTPFQNSLSPSAVRDWIQNNWPLVLGLVLGAIVLSILLKVTYVKKKPQIRNGLSRVADTIRRRTGMPKSASSSSKALADGPPLTSAVRHELRQKMKKEEAELRMKAFFPKTDERRVKKALKNSRNEEEAVKYLLKQDQPFAVPQQVPLLD